MYIILTDGVFFLDCDRTFELADLMLKICVGINLLKSEVRKHHPLRRNKPAKKSSPN